MVSKKCCKECFSNYGSVKLGYKKKSYKLKNDLEYYLRGKTSYLENKCKHKNLDFNLSKEYLFELYNKQQGKCYYTNLDIKHNIGCHEYNSIERLDPNVGYVKDNVVLAAFAINSFKGVMTELEFKKFLNIIIPKLIEYKNK